MSNGLSHLGFLTNAYASPNTPNKDHKEPIFDGLYRCVTFDTRSPQDTKEYESLMGDMMRNPNSYIFMGRGDYNFQENMFIRIEYVEKNKDKSQPFKDEEKLKKIEEICDSFIFGLEEENKKDDKLENKIEEDF